jgi:hypothetical protein
MVIETKTFEYFKHAYKGVYSDSFIVGIAEIFIFHPGAAEPIWERFEDRLPETLAAFRDLITTLKSQGAKLITFTLITPNGIAKRDFEIADILDFEPKQAGPLAGISIPVPVIIRNLKTCNSLADQEVNESLKAAVMILERIHTSAVDAELPERIKQFIQNVRLLRENQRELAQLPDNTATRPLRFDLTKILADLSAKIDYVLETINHK